MLHAEDKELFIQSRIQFYMQKAKRSSSTSIHPTRPSNGIPGIPAARPSKGIPDIPDIPVIHDIQPSRHYYTFQYLPVPSSTSRVPPHYSILQLECIFYIFYTSTGFHKKLHRVPVETLQTFILQRKGDVVISVKTYRLRCQADIYFK